MLSLWRKAGLAVLGLAIVASLAVVAEAQERQRGPRGPGGRGGFGFGFGPGGGMFGGGGGGVGGQLFMLANDAVKKELELSEDQVKELTSLGEEYRNELFPGGGPGGGPGGPGGFGPGGFGPGNDDLTDEERQKRREEFQARMEEFRKRTEEINATYEPKLNEVLLPHQAERLQQIGWQMAGINALADPKVIEALAITGEQTEQMNKVREEFGAKMRELFPGFGRGGRGRRGQEGGGQGQEVPGDPQEGFRRFQEMQTQQNDKLLAVLTDEQKTKFEELKGEPFDVSQLRPQFGPGGPGGPGGGRRGGRPRGEGRPPMA